MVRGHKKHVNYNIVMIQLMLGRGLVGLWDAVPTMETSARHPGRGEAELRDGGD
jgi:hypothetical protein